MQVGSDGVQACASCHFRAGADPRSKNQLSPGLRHVPTRDLTYTTGGPNYQLQPTDFPLTRLATPGRPGRAGRRDRQRRRRLLARGPPPGGGTRSARLPARRREHPAGRAAQHAVHDQRRVQPPAVLGWTRRERLQWCQSPRDPRPRCQGPPFRRSRAGPVEVAVAARELQPGIPGGGADRERSRDGRSGSHGAGRGTRAWSGPPARSPSGSTRSARWPTRRSIRPTACSGR